MLYPLLGTSCRTPPWHWWVGLRRVSVKAPASAWHGWRCRRSASVTPHLGSPHTPRAHDGEIWQRRNWILQHTKRKSSKVAHEPAELYPIYTWKMVTYRLPRHVQDWWRKEKADPTLSFIQQETPARILHLKKKKSRNTAVGSKVSANLLTSLMYTLIPRMVNRVILHSCFLFLFECFFKAVTVRNWNTDYKKSTPGAIQFHEFPRTTAVRGIQHPWAYLTKKIAANRRSSHVILKILWHILSSPFLVIAWAGRTQKLCALEHVLFTQTED